jgi:hypothetical protein
MVLNSLRFWGTQSKFRGAEMDATHLQHSGVSR